MSLAAKVREQLISSFRAELAEHVQTMNDGLLILEQGTVEGEQRKTVLENIFRAAHSLKGAARAMGVTMVEQLAHGLESALDDLQNGVIQQTTRLFTACYRAVDAIQVVQTTYEAGEITPPVEALQALAELEGARAGAPEEQDSDSATIPEPSSAEEKVEPVDVVEEKTEPVSIPGPEPGPLDSGPALPVDLAETAPPSPPEPTWTDDSAPISPVPAFGADETIRVSVSKLDALMAQLSELLVTKIRAEQRLSQVLQLQEFIVSWQKEWLAVRNAYNRLLRHDLEGALGGHGLGPVEVAPGGAKDRYRVRGRSVGPERDGVDHKVGKDVGSLLGFNGTSQERLREMQTLVNKLSREYANDTMHMSLVIDELEQEIKRVRMLPLTTITGAFGRMVRDLAQESKKEAVFQIIGGETELDKRVLEQIKDPLIHLLRNAVDHGIESPREREAVGKSRVGTITLTAEQLGKDVVISVSDDGGGLDLRAIRGAISKRSGVDAQLLSDEDLREAIFTSGITTSPIITDISGRGVGLDVVRRNVEALHGRIDVESELGQGATFTLILPLTLTSSRGLLVETAGKLFVIPHNAIEYIMQIVPQDVIALEGHDAVLYGGRPLALVRLADVLNLQPMEGQRDGDRIPVVILAAAERRMAFAVDALAGEQEVVIKGLGNQLTRVGGIAGATVMGSGEVVLILNVADLIKLGLRGEHGSVLAALVRPAPTREVRAQKRVLVVDDSITTRTLEKNILEAAGYLVQLATDGQEALGTIAAEGVPDLIVSDVVMPRLDGFGLTQRLKEDPRTADIPVILVTSLDSAEDKSRGIEVGADAYITKSTFDQNNLLETIEQLI
jgi:two-component system chemotaxis sensor kinase CheA